MLTASAPDLTRRIVTIGEVAGRAEALTAMITDQLNWDPADVDVASHMFLLTDQMCETILNSSGDACRDADDVFLDIVGIDRATWDAFVARTHRDEPGMQDEMDRFNKIREGIPDVNEAMDTLGTANDEFRASFGDAAEDAIERLVMTAVMLTGHASGPDRTVAIPVAGLTCDERVLVILHGDVSWHTGIAVVGCGAALAGYLCAERGAIDLGDNNPLPDMFAFSARIKDAVDNGIALEDAYSAAYVCAAGAPCNNLHLS